MLIHNKDTFIVPPAEGDEVIQIRNIRGEITFEIRPYSITAMYVDQNMIKVKLKASNNRTSIHFLSNTEAIIALRKLQAEIEKLKAQVLNVSYDVINYIDTRFLELDNNLDDLPGLDSETGVNTRNGISIVDEDYVGLGGDLSENTTIRTLQNSLTIDGNFIIAGTSAQYSDDYSAYFTPSSIVDKRYVDNLFDLITSSDIDLIVAGTGLTGGGDNGTVSLSITSPRSSIELTNDGIDVIYGDELNTAVQGNISYEFIAGDGLTGSNLIGNLGGGINIGLDIKTIDGITIINDHVAIDNDWISGDGLTSSGGTLSVNTKNGVVILNDSVGLGGNLIQNTLITTGVNTLNIDGNLLISTNAVNYDGDLSSTFGTYSLIDKNYLDVRLTDINFLFDAGAGLTGSGLSGNIIDGITLGFDINTINGISIIQDSVGLGGTLSQNTTITTNGNVLNIDGQLTITTNPINYAADYSAQYVDRSLIDLEYLNERLTEISVEGVGVEPGQGLTASMPGVNLRLSSLGDVQRIVPSGETIDIATEFQNLLYGDLQLDGDINTDGKLTIINGTISGSGSVSNPANVEFIDLVEDIEKNDPKWNANKIKDVVVDDANKGATSSQFLSYNTSTTELEYQTLNFIHYQPVANKVWTLTHNLNRYPSVTVVDSGGSIIEGCATYVSANEVKLEFNYSFGGRAYLT